MARNEKLDDNMSTFLDQYGLTSEDPLVIEDNLIFHTLESLGSLYQVAIQNHSTSPGEQRDTELSEAKRRAFAAALRYFADNIQRPSAEAKEPFPLKWLKESFPDSTKLQNGRSWMPLHWAINSTTSDSDVLVVDDVEQLCTEYAAAVARDPEQAFAVSPLSMAVARANPSLDVVTTIIRAFPSAAKVADRDLAFPFMYAAAWNDSTAIVEHLRELHPASVEKADIYGFRALHYAAYVGSTEMVLYLLRLNPKAARQANQYGVLPLNACVVNNRGGVEMARAVHAAYPAAVTIADNNGLIPLHKAAQFANLDVVTFVFNAYPEGIATADEEGMLPLHYAGIRSDKNMDILEFVLAATPAAAQAAAVPRKQKGPVGADKECTVM
ncbi:BAD1 [Symbiodinium microadriaticum]|nr:BAD1 [Symbiodinium microadriaticum]